MLSPGLHPNPLEVLMLIRKCPLLYRVANEHMRHAYPWMQLEIPPAGLDTSSIQTSNGLGVDVNLHIMHLKAYMQKDIIV